MCATSIIVMTWLTLSLVGDLGAGEGADAAHGNSRFGLGAERLGYHERLPVLIPGTIAYVYFHWLSARFFEHT